MRIGIDIRLQNETGVGRYIRNLSKILPIIAPKHEFVLLNPPIRWHSLAEQLELPRYLKEKKLDLIHFPYFSLPILYSEKFVVTIHDLIINSVQTGLASTLPYPIYLLKRFGYHFVLQSALRKASAIIVPSKATKKDIEQWNTSVIPKLHVTYEGADDLSALIPKKPSDKNIPTRYFMYVGNAYPHKNLEFLLDAYKLFVMRNPESNIHLILVGKIDYFYKRLQEKVVAMKCIEKIHFMDYLSENELVWIYKNTTALIIPSHKEGFCLPIIEALSFHIPVIASNLSVFHEIFGDNVVYFSPQLNSLVDTMSYVGLHENSNDLLKKSKQGYLLSKQYTWKKTALETLAIYERCLGI